MLRAVVESVKLHDDKLRQRLEMQEAYKTFSNIANFIKDAIVMCGILHALPVATVSIKI